MIYIFFWFNVYSMLTTLFWSFLSSFPTAFFRLYRKSSVYNFGWNDFSLENWPNWNFSPGPKQPSLFIMSLVLQIPPPPQSLPQNHTTAPGSQLEFFRVWSSQPFIAYFLPFRLAFRCFPPLPCPHWGDADVLCQILQRHPEPWMELLKVGDFLEDHAC